MNQLMIDKKKCSLSINGQPGSYVWPLPDMIIGMQMLVLLGGVKAVCRRQNEAWIIEC